jgi:hypothetical protein
MIGDVLRWSREGGELIMDRQTGRQAERKRKKES